MSTEKVSTLTLRLTAEEAEQLERLKALVGKSTGSEALKYVMKEYPRFCAHYREEAKQRCVFRDDTHEKSPERGLPGPSHQFA